MERSEIVLAYAGLPPFPEFPGEREWPDRLRTPDEFLEVGPLVADDMRHNVRDWDDKIDRDELERRKAMFPELWALLFHAFPRDPLA